MTHTPTDKVSNLDGVDFLATLPNGSVQLCWTDPPFGTGDVQALHSTWTGTGELKYQDNSTDETLALIKATSHHIKRVLSPDGVFALLLDYRSIHEAVGVVQSTGLQFGGEIIYHFELGGVSRKWWTNKHNTIALFHKGSPRFYLDRVPTVPRKAPRGSYTSEERRVNSVWNYTMGPGDEERTGYPNQKPLAIIEPFVLVHTDPGDLCIDPFCGSGGLGMAAQKHGRRWLMNDLNPDAAEVASLRVSHALL